MQRQYIAIDLKSFYASVECAKRGLDALDTNLVVADTSRTDKTICLAVSPSLKSYGIKGRCRLFEVKSAIRAINEQRKCLAPNHKFCGSSYSESELCKNPSLELDFIVATPAMADYMKVSGKIYSIYLNFIAPEDIHVYSIDEVFMDVTNYLRMFKMTTEELAMAIIKEVLRETGITATAGIGTNLYLCKVAMDIMAKKMPPNEDGVRIAKLDEVSYRKELWNHRPITDFWRIGSGYKERLYTLGLYTMGDLARFSTSHEDLLYKVFGVNAELLIDHAWGWEPCTMAHIKAYKPKSGGLSTSQILPCPYENAKAKLILKEMMDAMALSLVEKGYNASSVSIYINYDISSVNEYKGQLVKDYYGRLMPKASRGSAKLESPTASSSVLIKVALGIFDKIVDKSLFVRRLSISVECSNNVAIVQPSLFDLQNDNSKDVRYDENLKNKRQLEVALELKKRFGRNIIVRGMDLEEGAMAIERNNQIGGHKA